MGTLKTNININDKQLCSVVREICQTLPDADKSYVISVCRQRNIFVQRQRVRDAINNFDPVSRASRKLVCIMLWVYIVLAPN